jgi:hypothetical protein
MSLSCLALHLNQQRQSIKHEARGCNAIPTVCNPRQVVRVSTAPTYIPPPLKVKKYSYSLLLLFMMCCPFHSVGVCYIKRCMRHEVQPWMAFIETDKMELLSFKNDVIDRQTVSNSYVSMMCDCM